MSLRAVRVPDALWEAALGRARARGETVSEIVRQALSDYTSPRPDLDTPDHEQIVRRLAPSVGDVLLGEATELAPPDSSRFLVAQGMVMQRLGIDAAAAAQLLQILTVSSGTGPSAQGDQYDVVREVGQAHVVTEGCADSVGETWPGTGIQQALQGDTLT
jgi:hypothetical protein